MTLLNKVVTRLKEQEIKLKYSKLEGDKWHITVFADASKGNLGNKVKSTVAYLIFLSDGYQINKKKKCNILAWQSKKARRDWGDAMIKVEAFTDCMDVYNAMAVKNKPNTAQQKGDQLSSLDVAAVSAGGHD